MSEHTDVVPSQAEDARMFSIRYEGLDCDGHKIDLDQLGQSLQGFARVLAVCSHFVETGKYNKQFNALSVEVYAAPVQEHHCYEVIAQIVDKAASTGVFQGLGGVTLATVVNYVMNRRKADEMKYLNEALQRSLDHNERALEGILETMSRMADSLAPSARKASEPVGKSCSSISLHRPGKTQSDVMIDLATKESLSPAETHIEPSRSYVGIISEMDMDTGACKVALDDDPSDSRTAAVITDPQARSPQNAYVTAMSNKTAITFTAKAEVNADGDVVKLYISDCEPSFPSMT